MQERREELNTGIDVLRRALDAKDDPATWETTLGSIRERLAIARLTPEALAVCIGGCGTPDELAALARVMSRHPLRHPGEAGPFTRIKEAAEPFSYPLESWIGALARLQGWLQADDRPADFEKMLGYVYCSAESGDSKPTRPDLREEVSEMLDTFGYDG